MDISNPEQEIFSNLDPELELDIDPPHISEFPNADDIATCPSTDNSIHDSSIEPVGSSNCEDEFDLQSDPENGQSIFDKTSQDSESYKENILKCLDQLTEDVRNELAKKTDGIVTVDLEDESMDNSTEDYSSKDKPQQHRSKEVDNIVPVNPDETLDISTKDSLDKDKPQQIRSKEADEIVTVYPDEEIMENSLNDNSSKDQEQKEAKDKVTVNLDGESIDKDHLTKDNLEDDNDNSAKDHSSKEAENVATVIATVALEEMIEKSEKDISVKDTLHKVTLNDENVAIEVSDDISPTADNDVITLDESDDSSNDSSFQKYDISSKRKRRCDVLDISTDASQFDDDTSRFGDEIVLSDGDDDCVDISNDKSGNFLFNGWRYRSRVSSNHPTTIFCLSMF